MSRIRRYAPMLLAGVLAACGESPADPQPPGDEDDLPFTQVACPALSLDATSGLPMQQIAIGELPSASDRRAEPQLS